MLRTEVAQAGSSGSGVNPPATSSLDPASPEFVREFSPGPNLRPVNRRLLNPYLRGLLTLDGTVTKLIEAWTMDRVRVVVLGQTRSKLVHDVPELEAKAGTWVLSRSVILEGSSTGSFHAHAISLAVLPRLSSGMEAALEKEERGLGQMLENSELETRRDVLWFGREARSDLPLTVRSRWDDEFIVRTYRINTAGKPLLLVSERFPHDKSKD